MTDMETRARELFAEVAVEMPSAPLLARLDRRGSALRWRRRLLAAGTVATVAAAAVGAALVVTHFDGPPQVPQPADRPPKVLRLSGLTSDQPGRARMLVTFTIPAGAIPGGTKEPTFVVPADAAAAVKLPLDTFMPDAFSQALSADGTRLVRQRARKVLHPRLAIQDLRSGRWNRLGNAFGTLPELSPDNRTLAVFADGGVRLLDVRSGRAPFVRGVRYTTPAEAQSIGMGIDPTVPAGAGLGWSPDGERLAIALASGIRVVDTSGTTVRRFSAPSLANGSMSWSPDGRSLLAYDRLHGSFLLLDIDGEPSTRLAPPEDAVRPFGWAGDRIVWLAGDPGKQRLVTTDRNGADEHTWMRFDVGNRAVKTVTWSRALSG
jgi:hypothetical protein